MGLYSHTETKPRTSVALQFHVYSVFPFIMIWVVASLGVEITHYPNNKEKNQCRLDFKHNKYILLILTNTDGKGKSHSGSVNEVAKCPDCSGGSFAFSVLEKLGI